MLRRSTRSNCQKNHSLPDYYIEIVVFCQIPFDEVYKGTYNRKMSKKSSDSRKFPELLPRVLTKELNSYQKWFIKNLSDVRRGVVYFVLVILTIFSFVLMFIFVELLDQYKALQEEQASIKSELLYWENALVTVPNSPDIYFQAGVAAFQLGDKELAAQYITKAIDLDPNFEAAIQLQEKISNE